MGRLGVAALALVPLAFAAFAWLVLRFEDAPEGTAVVPSVEAQAPRAADAPEPERRARARGAASQWPLVESAAKAVTLQVRVLDEAGRPAAGARVALGSPDRFLPGGETSAAGVATLAEVEPGEWLLYVERGESVAVLPFPTDPSKEVGVRLEPGVAVQGRIDAPVRSFISRGAWCRLTFRTTRGSFWWRAAVREDGTFRFPRLPLRRAVEDPVLAVSMEGFDDTEIAIDRVRAGEPLVVTLGGRAAEDEPAAAVVQGRCVDAAGSPVAGAVVRCVPFGDRATTGPDGRFRVGVAPGEATRLLVNAEGAAPVEVVAAAAGDVGDVRLEVGATLRGTFLAEGTDAPVAGATVRAGPPNDPRWERTATTDADGAFTIAGLPDEPLRVLATTPGRYGSAVTVRARGVRASEPLRLVLPAGRRVRLLLSRGADVPRLPLRRVTLRLLAPEPPHAQADEGEWSAPEDLRELVHPAAPGRYVVEVVVPGAATARVEGVEVGDERETVVPVVLSRDPALR